MSSGQELMLKIDGTLHFFPFKSPFCSTCHTGLASEVSSQAPAKPESRRYQMIDEL